MATGPPWISPSCGHSRHSILCTTFSVLQSIWTGRPGSWEIASFSGVRGKAAERGKKAIMSEVMAKPKVKLSGEDGNAFAILGRVSKALRSAGMKDKIAEYMAKAMSGDYDHLLEVTMEYVDTY